MLPLLVAGLLQLGVEAVVGVLVEVGGRMRSWMRWVSSSQGWGSGGQHARACSHIHALRVCSCSLTVSRVPLLPTRRKVRSSSSASRAPRVRRRVEP